MNMTYQIIRLITDSGLLVLIWLVQLVIYPSFIMFQSNKLKQWHSIYTRRVTLVVLPLMTVQLGTAIAQVWEVANWYTLLSMIGVISIWVLTFLVFVPLHRKIDVCDTNKLKNVCFKLVYYNWTRTLLWSLLFIMTVYQWFK